MLRGMLARLAVTDFACRVHPRQKQLAVLLDHAADPQALHDIRTDADDFHGDTLVYPWGQVPTCPFSPPASWKLAATIYAPRSPFMFHDLSKTVGILYNPKDPSRA